ncbi:MAG: UbiA family prenyltransferase, partial [Neisseriaceae bacterium]|nr:UbiA family prenyltransferase [Neisseriaceae bacterium]
VVGMFFLQTHTLNLPIFLPATALGLWSVAVLNINNIRDLDNDKQCGKNTIAVRLGKNKARHYHAILIFIALILWSIYAISYHYYWAIILPVLFSVFHIKTMYSIDNTKLFNIELAKLSLAVLLFVVLLFFQAA